MTERDGVYLSNGHKKAPSDTDDAYNALLIDDSYVGIIQIRFRVVHLHLSAIISSPCPVFYCVCRSLRPTVIEYITPPVHMQ